MLILSLPLVKLPQFFISARVNIKSFFLFFMFTLFVQKSSPSSKLKKVTQIYTSRIFKVLLLNIKNTKGQHKTVICAISFRFIKLVVLDSRCESRVLFVLEYHYLLYSEDQSENHDKQADKRPSLLSSMVGLIPEKTGLRLRGVRTSPELKIPRGLELIVCIIFSKI